MSEANRKIARDFVDALSNGDLPDAILTDDMTSWTIPTQVWNDKARTQFGIRLLASLFQDGLAYTVHSLTAEEDRVAADVTSTGTLINGEAFFNHYLFLLTIRNGRVSCMKEYCDPVPVKAQIAPLMQEAIAKMTK